MKNNYLFIGGIVIGLLLANVLPEGTSIFIHIGLALSIGGLVSLVLKLKHKRS